MIVWYLFEMRTTQEVGNDAENDPGEEAPLPDFPRLIGLVPGEKTASSLEEPIVIECDSDDDSDQRQLFELPRRKVLRPPASAFKKKIAATKKLSW